MQELLAKHWSKRQFHTPTRLDHARGWDGPGGEPAEMSRVSSAPSEADCQRENTAALFLPWGRQWDPAGATDLLDKRNDPNSPRRAPRAVTEDRGRAIDSVDISAQYDWNQTTHGLQEHVKSLHLLVQALHCSVLQNAEILNCSKTYWEQALHSNCTEIFLLRILCYPRLARKKQGKRRRAKFS